MDVVLVNGPAGVGKTTVGRRLAATARNGICIHGDDLRAFIVVRDPRAVGRGLSYAGGAALADVFLDAGYELVVFDFVFPSGRQVARFHEALRTPAPVHLLTLWAPLTTVTAREAARPRRAFAPSARPARSRRGLSRAPPPSARPARSRRALPPAREAAADEAEPLELAEAGQHRPGVLRGRRQLAERPAAVLDRAEQA